MLRKKLRFVSLGVLLGALLVTSSMTAEGGIDSWTSTNGPEGGWMGGRYRSRDASHALCGGVRRRRIQTKSEHAVNGLIGLFFNGRMRRIQV